MPSVSNLQRQILFYLNQWLFTICINLELQNMKLISVTDRELLNIRLLIVCNKSWSTKPVIISRFVKKANKHFQQKLQIFLYLLVRDAQNLATILLSASAYGTGTASGRLEGLLLVAIPASHPYIDLKWLKKKKDYEFSKLLL